MIAFVGGDITVDEPTEIDDLAEQYDAAESERMQAGALPASASPIALRFPTPGRSTAVVRASMPPMFSPPSGCATATQAMRRRRSEPVDRGESAASMTASNDDRNGAFDIILSAQTRDRDGDVLKSNEWKQPLPQ